MEGLLVLLLLVVLAGVMVGPILAIIALVRVKAVSRRVNEVNALRNEVARLSRFVEHTSAARPTATAAPKPEPKSVEPLSVEPPPVEQPPVAPLPAEPSTFERPPVAPLPAEPSTFERPPVPKPPAASPVSKPAAPPPPIRPKIEWERWVGIRGAAVLGAVALGLAGLLFFKYSIESGLITPAMRVVLGTFVGLGCLVGSEWLRRRHQRYASEGIAGAGVVILYAAFWAAHILYGLIPMLAAFVLMILVTAACCALAWRHSAFIVAVIGLVGGFATPLLLSTGSDRPIGLFGYVLLLDLGLLALGHKRRWPSLGMLSLVATVLIQALWIGARMGPDRVFLGLVILGVFAAVFVFATRSSSDGEARRPWLWTRTSAIFFPFAFAMYFAGRVDLGPHLYPSAVRMALWSAAAGGLSRESDRSSLGLGAAGASVGVTGVWLLQHRPDAALSFETVAVLTGLAVLFHLFVERDRERPGFDGPAPAALLSAGGAFALILVAVARTAAGFTAWPWVVGVLLLTGLLVRHAGFPGRARLQVVAASALGVALTSIHGQHFGESTMPTLYLALMVGVAVAAQAVAMTRRSTDVRRMAEHAAAALPVVLLVGLVFGSFLLRFDAAPALGSTLLLGVLAALAATRLGSGWWYAGAVAATLLPQLSWTLLRPDLAGSPSRAATALGFAFASVVAFTAWPFLASRRFSTERFAWYAAALAGPLWFLTLRRQFVLAFGDEFIGVLPVVLAAISVAALMRARKLWEPGQAMRLTALVWFAAIALGFVSVAIPLQLDKEWVTIGWALEGLAVLALWRRLDHPGLKYFGLALLGAASVRLVVNPALLGYYPRSAVRIFNWLMYTYLVPAATLVGSTAILKSLELKRLRPRERALYPGEWPIGTIATAIGAVLVVFVWINLAIADWFSTGDMLTLSFGATAAQRLTVSIAWALYGLVLLSLGMARDIQGLRWLSLAFLLGTIAKVFLYDLGNLRDLYRVFSLVGLAVSLLLVSFLYQRFVFRKGASEAG